MEVKTCKNCRRLFNYLTGPMLCASCKDKLEDSFVNVKDYIRKNPGCSMQIVSDECDVSIAQLREWVREERLQFSNSAGSGITCDKCGTPIPTGRFCEFCKKEMAQNLARGLTPAANKEEPAVSSRSDKKGMRFVNN